MDAYELKKARDKYLKQRKTLGLISRGYFKLEEIDKRFDLIKTNDIVLDLGAAPGGWCQYLMTKTKNITAVDILPIQLKGVNFIEKDFFQFETTNKFDVILSDMCPNISGVKEFDDLNFFKITNKFRDIVISSLKTNGNMVIKLFETKDYYNNMFGNLFMNVKKFKPKSSYKESREFYFIGLNKL